MPKVFYALNSNTSSSSFEFINATGYNATQANAGIDLPVRMRATPTMTYGNATGAYRFYRAGTNDSFDTLQDDSHSNMHLQFANNGGLSHTAGDAGSIQIRYGDGGFINADSEL